MSKVINIADCFKKFADTYSPKIVAELNGQHAKLVRLEGDRVPWHTHDNEDEMFYVLEGVLEIIMRNATFEVKAHEMYVVPRSTEHRVLPHGKVKLMLFEPAGIAHTGNVQADITKDQYDWLDI